MKRNCNICGKEIPNRRTCNSCRVHKSRTKKLGKIRNLFSKKCLICGYDKIKLLHFHHLYNKHFQIDEKGMSKSWEYIKEELQKCIPLCIRCHGEYHIGYVGDKVVDELHKKFWDENKEKLNDLN